MTDSDAPNSNAGQPDPQDPDHRERNLAQAIADFIDLQAGENGVDVEAFCRRHPELEPDLRTELNAVLDIDAAL